MPTAARHLRPMRSSCSPAGSTRSAGQSKSSAGYEGCRFIIGFGAITSGAATSIKVQQNTANATSGMADLEGSSITITDANDNKIAIAEVHLPRERYLRLTTLRATQNSVIDFLIVELYGSRVLPITDDATVISAEVSVSPAEGTA